MTAPLLVFSVAPKLLLGKRWDFAEISTSGEEDIKVRRSWVPTNNVNRPYGEAPAKSASTLAPQILSLEVMLDKRYLVSSFMYDTKGERDSQRMSKWHT